MPRIVLLIFFLVPFTCAAQTIYRTTDAQGNVVFTDSPPTDSGSTTEQVTLPQMNTLAPPEPAPAPPAEAAEPAAVEYEVTITSPANETSYPMGPGNFSASARVEPELPEDASLQLYVDGEPWGGPQRGTSWELTNVFRGQHDLTVGMVDAEGETTAMSEPVRVYVHRPSTNFKNKAKPRPKPSPH